MDDRVWQQTMFPEDARDAADALTALHTYTTQRLEAIDVSQLTPRQAAALAQWERRSARPVDFRQGIPAALQHVEDLAEVLHDVGLMQRVAGVYEAFGRWLERVHAAQQGRHEG